jgi:tetratricopeptide (TPR) repeat protein
LYYENCYYKNSVKYYTKALSVTESHRPVNVFFVVNYKNNIASALRRLNKHEEAMKIYLSLLPYGINKDELLHNIGLTYLDAGDFASAIHYLKLVRQDNQAKFNNIGYAYLQLKKFDSAGHFLVSALNEFDKMKSNQKNFDYGITLKYLGDLDFANQKTREALNHYQLALIQIDADFYDSQIEHNPISFQGLHNSFFLFNTFAAKARAFQALASNGSSNETLTFAFSTYSTAIRLARQVENTYHSDEAKLFLVNNVHPVYQEAIDLAIRLYQFTHDENYLKQGFQYAEESKASVLQAALQQLSLESIEGLPRELISEERISGSG